MPITLHTVDTVDQLYAWARDLLTIAGYSVKLDTGDWVTPAEIVQRLGVPKSTLGKRLRQQDCPRYTAARGPTGRILRLRLNRELETWLQNDGR